MTSSRPTRRLLAHSPTEQLDFGLVSPIGHDEPLTRSRRSPGKRGNAPSSGTRVSGFGIRATVHGHEPSNVVTHCAELRRLARTRIDELGITYASVDELAGFPDRYTSRLLCEPPMRKLTVNSMFALFGALALFPSFESDDATLARLRQRPDWIPRRRNGPQYVPRKTVAG